MLQEIPAFLGMDMNGYGPFAKDAVAELPEKIGELFLKRNLALKVPLGGGKMGKIDPNVFGTKISGDVLRENKVFTLEKPRVEIRVYEEGTSKERRVPTFVADVLAIDGIPMEYGKILEMGNETAAKKLADISNKYEGRFQIQIKKTGEGFKTQYEITDKTVTAAAPAEPATPVEPAAPAEPAASK